MPVPGTQFGGRLGVGVIGQYSSTGATTYAMAALNAAIAFRFIALSTADVLSVTISWSTVSAAGTVKLQIETVDATTGKPTGTLYDANATISFTPVAGTQTYTFATPPTTGLTVGTAYAVTLLTTTAGTTQTLRAYFDTALLLTVKPISALTTSNGTVPSNYVDVANAVPICSLILSGSITDVCGMSPYLGVNNLLTYGTIGYATKITLANPQVIAGIESVGSLFTLIGTTYSDFRLRIFDSSDNVISGTTVTVDKNYIVSSRAIRVLFPTVVTLSAGTYRIVFDSSGSPNSSNCYRLNSLAFLTSASVNSNFKLSTTTNLNGTPITWTDSTTDDGQLALILDSFGAGGSSSMKVHPGMSGGMNG